MHRRRVVAGLALGLIAPLLPYRLATLVRLIAPSPPQPLAWPLFRNPASAAAIGRSYLATRSAAPDLAPLQAQLKLPAATPPHGGTAAKLVPLRRRVRDDFDAGRVVHLNGWVLARTELELCALAELEHRQHPSLP